MVKPVFRIMRTIRRLFLVLMLSFFGTAKSAPLVTISGAAASTFDVFGDSNNSLYFIVFSPAPIAKVEAFLGDQRLDVGFDSAIYYQKLESFIPASGPLPTGQYPLTITATDIFSETGTAVSSVRYYAPPRLVVKSPEPFSFISGPTIRIEASAEDATSITATVRDRFGVRQSGYGVTNLTFTSSLSGTGSVEIVASGSLQSGMYGSYRPSIKKVIPVLVSTNGNLYPEATVPGKILDFDQSRFLFESNGVVRVSNRSGEIRLQSPAPAAGSTITAGFLTPFGAIFYQKTPYLADPDYAYKTLDRVFEIDEAGVSLISYANSLNKQGDWAVFVTHGRECFLRNLRTRQSQLVAEDLGTNYAAVTANGDFAFWKGVSETTGSIYLNNVRLDDGVFPQTDGNLTVYVKKLEPSYSSIWFHDETGNHQLTPYYSNFIPEIHYRAVNGWIAYMTFEGRIVKRSPSGEFTTLASVYNGSRKIVALSPTGDVIWIDGDPDFQGLWMFQNNYWEVLGGSVLFSAFKQALKMRFEEGHAILSVWGSSTGFLTKTNLQDQWIYDNSVVLTPVGPYVEYRVPVSQGMRFFKLLQ